MSDDDQPTGAAMVWSSQTGQTYTTTADDLDATLQQATADDAAYQAQLLQTYLDLLAQEDAVRSDDQPHAADDQ